MNVSLERLFSLSGQTAVVTGGSGALGSVLARGLAMAGARVAVLGRNEEHAEAVVAGIQDAGGESIALIADVLDEDALRAARETVMARWGRLEILVNAAGGNVPGATVPPDGTFFDLPRSALEAAVDLNFFGTLLPTQIFGQAMASAGSGSVVNISSLAAGRALSRVVGYAAGKTAVESLTRSLAVELARVYGAGLRVNAIAPGFFLGEQNRALLLEPDGSLSARGKSIARLTPAGRFGLPEELVGTLIWLCSPSASFVTGTVVTVDGGFSAFSGV